MLYAPVMRVACVLTMVMVSSWCVSYGKMVTKTKPLEQEVRLNKSGNRRGMHFQESRLRNLEKRTVWKPGQSGNPAGYSITARLRDLMHEPCPFDTKGRIWGEAIAEALARQSLTTVDAIKVLLDRNEGKLLDKKAILGEIIIKVVYGDKHSNGDRG